MNPKPRIILMSKWHAAKRCKQRLAKDIGIESAAKIQKQVTLHTISVAKKIEEQGFADIFLSISGLGPKASNRWAKSVGIKNILNQGKGCLGLRMRRQILRTCSIHPIPKNRKSPAIILGTDLPTLCERDLIEAINALKTHSMTLGPANDGGYWLIGLSKELINPLTIWPFDGIPWGTNIVLQTTIKKALEKDIQINFLRHQNDLDQLEDFYPWLN